MTWAIGDRQLEPDEEPECGLCDGEGFTWIREKTGRTYKDHCGCQLDSDPGEPNDYLEE
ncbi:hypothetical protein D3C81_2099000 [compost metagenome]